MKKQTKKLVLAKETVRTLGAEMLERVGGGQDISYICTQSSTYIPPETLTPSICNC